MIVAGVVIIVLGAIRGYTFFAHGGLVFLVLGVLFVGVGIASVVASVARIRQGDPPRDDPGGARSRRDA
ncbi:MAG TPA: hypothetical protein VHH12_07605 [Mycobacterium sp.]|nr:hypothetical protein [Mycobacterium sp.]